MKKYKNEFLVSLLLFIIAILCGCKTSMVTTAGSPSSVKNEKAMFIRDTFVVNNIEYRTGNYPLIITVPHGGRMVVDSLPLRTKVNCPDPKFSVGYDTYTPELGNLMDSVVYAKTGKYPYMIICRMKRTYVDMNRPLTYAIPKESKELKIIYNQFHDFIIAAKASVNGTYGSGLLLDFHAHGHKKQEIEIGYQLSAEELNLTDEQIENNPLISSKSGINNISKTSSSLKASKAGFAEILRGDNSFGTILKENGINCIPNKWNPSPGKTSYFSGGFITKNHGSGNGGTVDAIQLEFNSASRKEPLARKNTVEMLYFSVVKFFKVHYAFRHASEKLPE